MSKRFYILAMVMICSVLNMFAANDLIIKTNSEKIEAVIQEVSETEVRYKKADTPNGPVYVLKSADISTIIYANGEVQVMAASAAPQPQAQAAHVTPQTQQQAKSEAVDFDSILSAYQQQQKEQKAKKEALKNKYGWENFILANYQYGFNYQHAVGLTYGRVKQVGWYVSFSLGLGFHYNYDYLGALHDRSIYDPATSSYFRPFYSGAESHNQITATGGTIVRLGPSPVFFYAGIGYAFHSVTAETTDHKWVYLRNYTDKFFYPSGHGMNFDAGIQANIKGFTLSAGYSLLTNFDTYRSQGFLHEIKFGVGGMWKDKKKKEPSK